MSRIVPFTNEEEVAELASQSTAGRWSPTPLRLRPPKLINIEDDDDEFDTTAKQLQRLPPSFLDDTLVAGVSFQMIVRAGWRYRGLSDAVAACRSVAGAGGEVDDDLKTFFRSEEREEQQYFVRFSVRFRGRRRIVDEEAVVLESLRREFADGAFAAAASEALHSPLSVSKVSVCWGGAAELARNERRGRASARWSSLSHASRVERSVRGTRCAAQRSNGLLALAEQGDEDGEEEGEGEKREVYSALQWETSCFYTYECEVDGRPVSEEELRAKQREDEDEELYTHVALGVVRLGSSARDASIKWRTIDDDPSMSAKPWIDYRPVTGETINFKPGDIYKEVTLRVRPSSLFSGTLELAVWLEPESVQGAYVGKCEWQYRKCEAAGVRREPVCAHGYISIPHYYCCYYYCHHHHHRHYYYYFC